MAELEGCPFCGNNEIRVLPQVGGFSVDCTVCNATKRVFTEHEEQAIASWNKRADIHLLLVCPHCKSDLDVKIDHSTCEEIEVH
jgi:Lar family restriction alleviation protein